jgi:RNA polymerase sigma-70 factor (ECF subfamily)
MKVVDLAAVGITSERSPRPPLASEAAPSYPTSLDVEGLLRDHFDFIWRLLRRLGLDEALADDAAQEVFLIASRRMDRIDAGSERSFLFGTALRVASDLRKRIARRREVPASDSFEVVDPVPSPEVLVDQSRARALLDEMLDELPEELRAIFVLYELEELEMKDIADLLDLPRGTVASRLRRARAMFAGAARRRQAKAKIFGAST